MNQRFPYQLVSFIGPEPSIGEPVYVGDNGWYPQIALKRRFMVLGMSEDDMLQSIEQYCQSVRGFDIQTRELVSNDRMPVRVIEVNPNEALVRFHQNFISYMGDKLASRFPERDGDQYYPHITAEHDHKLIIDPDKYINRQFSISRVYILKDILDANSVAYKCFDLK